MEGLPLGINLRYLSAQLCNLVILFVALYLFAFKRFATMLDERSARIKKGLEDAETADKRAAEAEAVYQERLEHAEKNNFLHPTSLGNRLHVRKYTLC